MSVDQTQPGVIPEANIPGISDAPEPIPGGFVEGLLDSIVKEYHTEKPTFDVLIVLGGAVTKIPFRLPEDGKEAEDLKKDAEVWAMGFMPIRHKNIKVQPMSGEMKKWVVQDVGVLARVYMITRLSLHPDFQSEPKVMQLFRQAWPIFNSIMSQIDLAMTNSIVGKENEEFNNEKKD